MDENSGDYLRQDYEFALCRAEMYPSYCARKMELLSRSITTTGSSSSVIIRACLKIELKTLDALLSLFPREKIGKPSGSKHSTAVASFSDKISVKYLSNSPSMILIDRGVPVRLSLRAGGRHCTGF
uniref:Ragulator complex protein LAMTOR5 n=1 Tax=Schistocephalus solidus TaxID=70667 RepID=A0A0X3NQ53_SCHSO